MRLALVLALLLLLPVAVAQVDLLPSAPSVPAAPALPVPLPSAPTLGNATLPIVLSVGLPLPVPALPPLPTTNATNASSPPDAPITLASFPGGSWSTPTSPPKPDPIAPPAPQDSPFSPPPGVVTLDADFSAPMRASPVAAAVALGATALLAIGARLYSRFERDALLRSGPRARICELLAERPGATLPDLMLWTGLGRGALVHHARMLEKHGLVASRHDGLNRRLWLAGPRVDPPVRPPTPAERRLLDELREHGPLTQAELARRLDVSAQAVSQQVARLRRDARIVAQDERRWVLAPAEPPSAPRRSGSR